MSAWQNHRSWTMRQYIRSIVERYTHSSLSYYLCIVIVSNHVRDGTAGKGVTAIRMDLMFPRGCSQIRMYAIAMFGPMSRRKERNAQKDDVLERGKKPFARKKKREKSKNKNMKSNYRVCRMYQVTS